MHCLVGCFALIAPRLTIIVLVVVSDYLGRAYETVLWPLLGFVFLPTTTIAYAWSINSNGSVSGWYLVAVVIAVLIDLGLLGTGASSRRKGRPGSG